MKVLGFRSVRGLVINADRQSIADLIRVMRVDPRQKNPKTSNLPCRMQSICLPHNFFRKPSRELKESASQCGYNSIREDLVLIHFTQYPLKNSDRRERK